MKPQLALPITIVFAGLLIAGAVFLVGKSSVPPTPDGTPQNITYRSIDSTDHILGNPNAAVKVIEYADLECPYCKQFHTTMHQIMNYYGPGGQVAWVFRHFPLDQHTKAPKEAEASECAAEQGGNEGFFKYVDRLYSITPGENNLDLAKLPEIARDVGLNVDQFNQCLSSGKYASKVAASGVDAIGAGAQGTPYVLITLTGSSDAVPLPQGAQPYDSMRTAIDEVLKHAPSSAAPSTSPEQATTTP